VTAVLDVGAESGNPYIVSELLEGQTLAARLREGPLPVSQAVAVADQIASALAAAHDRGIVHRDLTPANVFLCRSGQVKVLDFGLARWEVGAGPLDETPRTAPGALLGTAGYTAPEQLRGVDPDARADIFSLGAVLHEMLSGRRAFPGTAAEVIGAILHEDPAPLGPPVPAALARLVQRCLQKRPEDRFGSAQDVRFALEAAAAGPAASPPVSRWPLRLVLVLGSVAALALAFWAKEAGLRREPPAWQRLTFRRGSLVSARFAPDGATVVYSAAWDGELPELFTTRRGSAESRALGLGTAEVLAVTAAGEMGLILDPRGRRVLAQASLAGGAPRELAAEVTGGDWTPDGRPCLSREAAGRSRIELPPGTTLLETAEGIGRLRVSPQGDRIAFFRHPRRDDNAGDVAVLDVASRRVTTLSPGWTALSGLAWSPDGAEVWFSGSRGRHALHAVTLDGRDRLLARAPSDLILQDVASDGSTLVAQAAYRREVRVLDREGARELSWLDSSVPADLSANGALLVFDEQGEGAGSTDYAIYARPTLGGPAVRLGEGHAHALSPDGHCVLAERSSDGRLFLLPTAATPCPELSPLPDRPLAARFFPDGRRLLVLVRAPAGPVLEVRDIAGGTSRRIGAGVVALPAGKVVAPDGSLAVVIDQDGRLALQPLEGGAPRALPGVGPGDLFAGWGADAHSVLVGHSERGRPVVEITRLDLASGRHEPRRQFVEPDVAGARRPSRLLCTVAAETCICGFTRSLSDLYLGLGLR
jgi:hypothetical protein